MLRLRYRGREAIMEYSEFHTILQNCGLPWFKLEDEFNIYVIGYETDIEIRGNVFDE